MRMADPPELPTLRPGVRLLDTDERLVTALHALVLDHVLMNDGSAYWVDSRGHATTTSLARLAPSLRTLDRIHVARGLTAFQHYSLIDDLESIIDQDASLVVVPAIDAMYRGDDLGRGEPEDLLAGVLERIDSIAHTHDLPVLVTRQTRDALTAPVEKIAEESITCEQTRFGPRFSADGFETLVYPLGNGMVQTTLAYWREILAARITARQQQSTGIAYGAD